ncbi:MAG: DedA family protein [Nitrospirae bacterium]|nr:DedA family protein [Nitrospirota bacterium]
MLEKLIALLSGFVIATISSMGYGGIVVLMAIESACIPLPSEVIMPFAGYLVFTGEFTLWGAALAGAVGCVLGSLVAYAVGASGGRSLVRRYGRYVLISHRDLAQADLWFTRHGDITVFVGRLLPVIRTFIALPAGISRMPMGRFVFYTFVGSYIWCYGLAWVGRTMGENWDTLGVYFHRFDAVIAAVLLAGAAWYVRRHWKSRLDEGE